MITVDAYGRKLNWKPSPHDERDHSFRLKVSAPRFTPKSDLTRMVPLILDQGMTGSCTGFSFKYLYMVRQTQHNKFDAEPSALYIYYKARELEGTTDTDAGAYIRDIIKASVKFGIPHEKTWPFDEGRVTARPTKAADEQAEKHQITAYNRLYGADDMRLSLSYGLPVIYGVTLFESFMDSRTAVTGRIPMPSTLENEVGGHAMCMLGHNDATKTFLGVQSWGQWGHAGGNFGYGFYTMPYDYIDRHCDESWNVTAGEQL